MTCFPLAGTKACTTLGELDVCAGFQKNKTFIIFARAAKQPCERTGCELGHGSPVPPARRVCRGVRGDADEVAASPRAPWRAAADGRCWRPCVGWRTAGGCSRGGRQEAGGQVSGRTQKRAAYCSCSNWAYPAAVHGLSRIRLTTAPNLAARCGIRQSTGQAWRAAWRV